MKYYIIIPAHNEEAFLALTLESILSQSLLPKKVVVVNDNSNDGTEGIIERFKEKHPIFEKINCTSSPEHMPGSKVINAFTKGLKLIGDDYDFLVKLDADLILPDRYFKEIADIFTSNPKVGIAGGFAYEKGSDGNWRLNHPMNKDHVRGAFKAYTKACFTAIGGLRNAIGWDTLDELLAQYHGFDIHTRESLKVKHLRPTGKAYNKNARLLQGKAMYTMGYGWLLTCIASLKMALKRGNPKVFLDNLNGFLKAKHNKVPLLVNREEADFIRKLRWANIRAKF
ncbi:MAG: glycosyltransferase family 2 protein [Bacteroidota bacterium]